MKYYAYFSEPDGLTRLFVFFNIMIYLTYWAFGGNFIRGFGLGITMLVGLFFGILIAADIQRNKEQNGG